MNKRKNGSQVAEKKQTTKVEVETKEFNSGLIGDSPPINFNNVRGLDIRSIGNIVLTLVLGVISLVGILVLGFLTLVKILVEHPFIISAVIFIIILCLIRTLPKDIIKALTEFIKSLPTRLFP